MTLAFWPVSRRGWLMRTISSPEASGLPSFPFASPGSDWSTANCSRMTALWVSLCAPWRRQRRFSAEPEPRKALSRPSASAMTMTKTATTRATPSTVIAVDAFRTKRFRQLYFRGSAIFSP